MNTHLRNLKRNLPSVEDVEKARQQSGRDLDRDCWWCEKSLRIRHIPFIRPAHATACLHAYRERILTRFCPHRTTPALLLVCKQITAEALFELRKEPLVLDWPYPLYGHPDLIPVFPLNHFINPRTLRQVPTLKIKTTALHILQELVRFPSGIHLLGSWSALQTMLKSEDSDRSSVKPGLEIEIVDDTADILWAKPSSSLGSRFVTSIVLNLMEMWKVEQLRSKANTSRTDMLLPPTELEEWEKAPRRRYKYDKFSLIPSAHYPSRYRLPMLENWR